jgi:hypothetical protein
MNVNYLKPKLEGICYTVDGCDMACYVSKDLSLCGTVQMYYYPLILTHTVTVQSLIHWKRLDGRGLIPYNGRENPLRRHTKPALETTQLHVQQRSKLLFLVWTKLCSV